MWSPTSREFVPEYAVSEAAVALTGGGRKARAEAGGASARTTSTVEGAPERFSTRHHHKSPAATKSRLAGSHTRHHDTCEKMWIIRGPEGFLATRDVVL